MRPGYRDLRIESMHPGDRLAARTLGSISGERIPVPDPDRLVHLQFRRFAGCPVCNLHLQSFVRRREEILAAGIREVVVFHSSADELLRYAGDLPLAMIADPIRRLYREFGVEASARALFAPRAWRPILRAAMHSLRAIIRQDGPVPPLFPAGGRFGLPADFLIGCDGRILASRYGAHADDQWSVDELLALAASRQQRSPDGRRAAQAGMR